MPLLPFVGPVAGTKHRLDLPTREAVQTFVIVMLMMVATTQIKRFFRAFRI